MAQTFTDFDEAKAAADAAGLAVGGTFKPNPDPKDRTAREPIYFLHEREVPTGDFALLVAEVRGQPVTDTYHQYLVRRAAK